MGGRLARFLGCSILQRVAMYVAACVAVCVVDPTMNSACVVDPIMNCEHGEGCRGSIV